MPENLTSNAELAPDVQTFLVEIRRKSGKLSSEEKITFVEPDNIERKRYDHRYICDVIAETDPNQPYTINLWDYVSPIWYTKEEYTFNIEQGVYIRSGVSAEPGFLETVPPDLYDWNLRPATGIDLGRVVGILEYLEKEISDEVIIDESKSKPGSKIAKWILGRK